MATELPDDAALVRQLVDGDEAAFAALVNRYHGSLVRIALTYVGDREVAQEVVQDTWMAVLTGIHAFAHRSSFKTWLFAILANRARSRAVREKRSIPFSALADDRDEGAAVDPERFTASGAWATPPALWGADSPEDQLLRREAIGALREALGELPSRQQAVVTLRDVEGLSAEETCNMLQISETNQRVLLHRGRSRLRAILERHRDSGGRQR